MKKVLYFFIVCVLAALFGAGCEKYREEIVPPKPDPAVVSAFTSGAVRKGSTIRVRFTREMVGRDLVGTELEQSPFTFTPKIKGTAVWVDERMLEFRPSHELTPGQDYTAMVQPGKAIDTGEVFKRFGFKFSVIRQSFSVAVDGLKIPEGARDSSPELHGVVETADTVESKELEKVLTAEQDGKLNIEWTHSDDARTHYFVVRGIERGAEQSAVLLKWNGKAIQVDKKGEKKVEIPPLETFKVVEIIPVQEEEEYVEIRFSDPIEAEQELQGFIWVDNIPDLSFNISGNTVKVYSRSRWPEEAIINIEQGILNESNDRLKEGIRSKLVFAAKEPAVRIPGKGVILPASRGLTIPIETVNLKGIVVEATRIYEDNIAQFLQVNTLEGDRELWRVGNVVWRKTLSLDWAPENVNRWVRTGLDLTELVKDNPRGMYRLKVYFKKEHIVYNCPDFVDESNGYIPVMEENDEEEVSNWDYWDWEYNRPGYFENRNNPCHPAFYYKFYDHDIAAYRNVLVSDIGLTAKKGDSDSMFVAAAGIKTARPLPGVDIQVLNYQLQEIGGGRTGQDGFAGIDVAGVPFLIVAEKEEQKGYLKVDKGSALSISHFDVGGAEVKSGIKGFIYGDRGVWRPGDPIYLSFILMSEGSDLPSDHPVRLQFFNPRGLLVSTVTKSASTGGIYDFPLETKPDAPTGNWNVKITVGGAEFEKTLKIETVVPNRLKIDLDFGPGVTELKSGNITADISSMWLHGAPAGGLDADVSVSFNSIPTVFSRYSDYVFDDPVRVYQTETQTIFEGKLDEKGERSVDAAVYTQNESPGLLRATFKSRVFEPGGAASTDRFSIPFHPYERYVGIKVPKGDKARGMLLTDTEHRVDIVVVDTEGNPVPSARVEAMLYNIKWRWWWEKGEENLANYVGTSSYMPIDSGEVEIRNGTGSWSFEVKYPAWGRYLVRVRDTEGNHITGKIVYVDWPGWAGRAQSEGPGGASVLTFTADKESYKVGEKAVLTIPTGKEGSALVSVEAGGELLLNDWIKVSEESSRYEFKVTPEMTPNAYAHVSLLQPHMSAGNDMPIRMYGIIPIKVEDPETHLHPVIESPGVFRPEETSVVTVSESAGRPMAYTLAVVDEGLLGLTRFKTPDPWSHFYSKEANRVKSWDLYDTVAAAYGGVLEQLLAVGGGEDLGPPEGTKAKRFPPMVRFLGPFELGAYEKNEHAIDVPMYVGAVRIMCVAAGGKSFGSTSEEVPVRKPLMVLGTLPRVLSVDEEVEVPVSVFVLEDGIREVEIRIAVGGPVSLSGFDSKRTAVKTLNFSDIGDKLVSFRLKAGGEPGIASVTINAIGGREKARHYIEFDVRVPNEPVAVVKEEEMASGRVWSAKVDYPGITGTNYVSLEVSRIPPLNLSGRLNYLISYPHGCLEQVVSAVFPQLYLDKLVKLSPERSKEIQDNVESGIERIRRFQTPDGAFSLWPGESMVNEWATSYAGHFLMEAMNRGYRVPAGAISHWKRYQLSRARSWTAGTRESQLQQAYRLYTLALAGEPAIGAMNRFRETKGLEPVSKWRLAAAYYLAGQKEVAMRLADTRSFSIPVYRELSGTFGSDLRDEAMILEAAAVTNRTDMVGFLVKDISRKLAGDEWLSTQTIGFALLAVAKYSGAAGGGSLDFTYRWNKGQTESVSADSPVYQLTLPPGGEGSGNIRLENVSGTTLYARVMVEGVPRAGEERASENGIEMSVEYQDMDSGIIDSDTFEQGTDFIAAISVKNPGDKGIYRELALSHVVPAGWEIHNLRLDESALEGASLFKYQDIRDDRIYTYFDLEPGETKTFKVLLNASYLGSFYLPLIKVEAMYDASINARTAGRWIEVKRQGDIQNW